MLARVTFIFSSEHLFFGSSSSHRSQDAAHITAIQPGLSSHPRWATIFAQASSPFLSLQGKLFARVLISLTLRRFTFLAGMLAEFMLLELFDWAPMYSKIKLAIIAKTATKNAARLNNKDDRDASAVASVTGTFRLGLTSATTGLLVDLDLFFAIFVLGLFYSLELRYDDVRLKK